VVSDTQGRVLGFQEKPQREQARSDLCNCGIYVFEPEILSHIPEGQFDDFGKRLFPDLLKQNVPFHAREMRAYWSDVGNLGEYVRGNADALARRVTVEIPGQELRPGIWVEADAHVSDSARLEPPLAIGRGCRIGNEVVIEGPAVIGEDSVVGDGARLVRTLLLPQCEVGPGQILVDGIVGRRADADAGH
jgi:NDP-sugar pyrophosphorylase family protein